MSDRVAPRSVAEAVRRTTRSMASRGPTFPVRTDGSVEQTVINQGDVFCPTMQAAIAAWGCVHAAQAQDDCYSGSA